MNREQKRFQAAVAAMQSLMRHEGYIYVHWKNLAKYSVEIADYLLADLDATAVSNEPQTPQPDADGWIPHCPGDPMPCAEDFKVAVRFIDGIEDESNTAGFWRGVGGAPSFWDESGEETIIAWKPA